jgi:hypothetical protein
LEEIIMKKTKNIFVVGGLCLFLICAGCQKKTPHWKGIIEIEDGVTVVKNSMEPIYKEPVLELQEDLTVKGSEDIEEQMFQNINTLGIDDEGNLYILDELAGNIKVFDQKGDFLKTIGKKGQGPGELGMPISLAITPNQNIIVNDMGQRKILFFDKEGNYLKQFSIADKFLFFGPMVTSTGDLIASHTIPQDNPVTELTKFNQELEPLLTFTSIPVDKPPAVNIFVARSLSSLRWTLTDNDEIIWGDIKNPEYELYVHNQDGTLIKKITRNYDPLPITAEDKDKLIEETFGQSSMRDQWDVRFPDTYPPYMGFSTDDEGHILVRRYEKQENEQGGLVDIFDSDGRYMAQVRLKMNPLIFKKGHMYTIEEDEEGFRVVKRYKVNWNM